MSPTPAQGQGEELSTEVVVVRHGETAWNVSRIVQVRPLRRRPSPPLPSPADSSPSLCACYS